MGNTKTIKILESGNVITCNVGAADKLIKAKQAIVVPDKVIKPIKPKIVKDIK